MQIGPSGHFVMEPLPAAIAVGSADEHPPAEAEDCFGVVSRFP